MSVLRRSFLPVAERSLQSESSLSRSQLATLVAPAFLWLVLMLGLPLVVLVLMSVSDGRLFDAATTYTLEGYRVFLGSMPFQRVLLRSIWLAALVGLFTVLFSYPVAYFLAFQARTWRNTLFMLLLVPALTSFLLRVLAWRVILGSSGVLATTLLQLGLVQEAAPVLLYTPTAVVITLVYVWLPFAVLPMAVALDRIPPSLHEAAADLGAPPLLSFLRVTLPLSMPGAVGAFLLVFIPTVGEYVTPALVGGTEAVMIGNIITDQFTRAFNWPLGAVLSLVMLLSVLVLVLAGYWLGRALRWWGYDHA